MPPPLLSFALKQAQSNGTDDRFLIGPGVFASTNFTYQSAERLQIIGAGSGTTILRGNMDGPVLDLAGDQDTSVSNLTIEPTDAATVGLKLTGTRARRVAVAGASAPALHDGVEFYGDASLDDSSVDIGSAAGYALIAFSGSGSVTGSTLSAHAGAALATAADEVTVRRSTLDGQYGALAARGHVMLSDTFVDMRSKAIPAIGVYADANSAGAAPTIDAARLTLVGSTPADPDPVGVVAYADTTGAGATVHLSDSVISGLGTPIARIAKNGGTANLTTGRSVYSSNLPTYDDGPGSLVEQNHLKVSPGFVGGGDFHPAAGSALIDAAGTPGGLPAGATDRDGRPRVSDGNGDCTHVPDIGAFEYQGTRVKAVATAGAASVEEGRAVGFSAAGSCVPDPGQPTMRWSFGDGATATGANVAHAFTTAGRHTATVTVTDAHGHSAQASASVEVTAAAAGGAGAGGAGAGGPAPSAPRLTRLRVAPTRVLIGATLPKLVRTSVRRPLGTIRFRLSEPATVTLRFAKLSRSGKARPVHAKIRINARKGRDRIRFAARLTRAVRLEPGAYRVTAIATGKTGLRSKRARAAFTAIGRRRG